MEPELRYTWIGAALLLLVAALVAAVLWLRGAGAAANFQVYEIVFARQSLEGLEAGSSVSMRGIRVGQVVSFSLPRDRSNNVSVTIRVDRGVPVSDNTVAVVARNLLTGLARISLVTPDPPGAPLASVENGAPPVIKEGTSTDERIEEAANRFADSGIQALEGVRGFLSQDNQQSFGDALRNVADTAKALETRLERLDRTLTVVERNVNVFGRASESIALSARTIQTDFSDLKTETSAVVAQIGNAASGLERDSAKLGRQLDAATGSASLDLRATAQELRQTAELLDRTLNRLRDPRAALFGPHPTQLGPGEKAK
jgi:phospholipid/cholesterol/gamma-HCH transport system substrate-binding protein